MILRNLLAMVAVGASLALTHVGPVNAATITWNFSVPAYGTGGSASGIFSVDTTASSLLSVDISTTAGGGFPASQYTGTAGSSIISTEVTFLDTTSSFALTLNLNSGSLFVPADLLSVAAFEGLACGPDISCEFRGGGGTISAATPLPAALPLFATGIGALGFVGWRRKKKAATLAA